MHHSLNGTRLKSGLMRTTELTVLTVGIPLRRQYTTIASRCLFLAESIGRQASGRSTGVPAIARIICSQRRVS
jgi:hypothetical protein